MKTYLNQNPDLSGYSEIADECPIWSAPFGLKLLDNIKYRKNIKALDIGFGTGFPLTEIALRLGNNSIVYGIDPWLEATERAKKKISFYNISNIIIINCMAESVPLESGTIDLVTSNNGINNVNDINKVLAECSRIMKAGGQFIQTYNLGSTMFEFYNELESVLKEAGMNNEIEAMHLHIHEKRKPLNDMINLMNVNGFIIKAIEHSQFNYRFADATAMLNHYFIRLAFMQSWIKLLPADRVESIFDNIEQRLNKKSELTGGFTLSVPFVLIDSIKRDK